MSIDNSKRDAIEAADNALRRADDAMEAAAETRRASRAFRAGLSQQTVQARVMFEVDACPSHVDCEPCPSVTCREEQGEMPNRALCFAHECHRCASRLADAAIDECAVRAARWAEYGEYSDPSKWLELFKRGETD